MEKQEKNTATPYDLDGRPPLKLAIPLGLQHVLAMFVGNLTPLLIITAACGIEPGGDLQVALLQNAMLIAGIVTLVQVFTIGPVGGKLPIVMGTSSGFIGVCQSVAGVMGNGVVAYGAIMAASFIGGLFETVLGSFLKPLRKFFPSVVTGTVVLSIGLSLISVGIGSFGGGSSSKDYGSLENLFVGLVVLIVIIALKHGTKGFTSFASILIGIIVGYVLVSIMAAVLPTTFTYVDDAGATVEATDCLAITRQHSRKRGKGMEKQEKNTVTPYDLDGRPPLKLAIPLGLQHVLAMFVGNLTPLLIITAACGIEAGGELQVALLQNAMLIAGIVTLVQVFTIGPVGGKLPIVMGTSSGFIGVCQSVAGVMGNGVVAYGAIMAASFIGGLFETVLGSFLKPLRKFFPSVVTGTVVLSIGLSLIAVGISSFGGGSSAKDYGSLENLFVGFVVLVVIVVLKHGTKGFTSFASILIGIIVGYVLVSIMAAVLPTTFTYVDDAGATVEATKSWVLNWDKVASASWFAVPKIMPVKWVFDARAIVPICIMFIVTAVETVGDISGITEGGLGREATDKELSGGVMCDGLGSSLAAVFGVLPNTSFSQNVGLVAMNKVVNRFSIATGGIFLIACGLFPKLAALISIMPQSVLGGAAVMMFSSIVVSGIQLITKWPVTPRNVTIVSVALGLGYGLGANSAVLAHMPQAITLIFGGSGIVPAALFAIILNIVLPPDEKSEVEIAEEILDMKKKEAQKK